MPFPNSPIPKYPSVHRMNQFRRKTHDRSKTRIQYELAYATVPFGHFSYVFVPFAELSCYIRNKEFYLLGSEPFEPIADNSMIYFLKIKCHRNPTKPIKSEYDTYEKSFEEIRSIIGTATTERSTAMRAKIGCNQPSVHSTCESKNVKMSP